MRFNETCNIILCCPEGSFSFALFCFYSTICIIVLGNRVEEIIIGNFTEVIIPAVTQACCIFKHQGIPFRACACVKKDKNEFIVRGYNCLILLLNFFFFFFCRCEIIAPWTWMPQIICCHNELKSLASIE